MGTQLPSFNNRPNLDNIPGTPPSVRKKLVRGLIGLVGLTLALIILGFGIPNLYCKWFSWGCKPSILTPNAKETMYVEGSQLKDACGNSIKLVGVNKMSVFRLNDEPDTEYFKEIAKTGANCVRIAWGIRKNKTDLTTPVELDSMLSKCRQANLIPIVGLWDYTDEDNGGFSKLQEYVDFWKKPETLTVLRKYKKYLIINIANEASVEGFDDDTFLANNTALYVQKYADAIQQIRDATGLEVPLMIDGLDRGKSLRCFSYKRNGGTKTVAQELIDAHNFKNIIFSAHVYWPKSGTNGNNFIRDIFNEAVSNKFCFVLGEVSKYGAYTGKDANGKPNPVCVPAGEVDYLQFLNLCHNNNVGYMIWEWGPGNDAEDATCTLMNMTSDSRFTGLQDWAIDVVNNPVYGIRANATPLPSCK